MIRAAIIDDVAEAREALKADLQAYCPEITLVGEAEGVVTGAKLIRKVKPELVFLDIQMQDGSGFDLLEVLGTVDFKLIFTTASDAYAIRAFRYAAVDYLLKPIDPEELTDAVARVEQEKVSDPQSLELLQTQLQQDEPSWSKIALHTQEKIHIEPIKDIVRLESSGNYTRFFFQPGNKLLVTRTLKEFDAMLKDRGFLRVHQSHLVNCDYLKEYVKFDGGYLVMKDGTEVPVSTRRKNAVLQQIERL